MIFIIDLINEKFLNFLENLFLLTSSLPGFTSSGYVMLQC